MFVASLHPCSSQNLAALLCNNRGDWAGAEKEFLRILEIDPAHAAAKQFLPIVRQQMRK
jgi:hypothetical protein